MRSPKRTPRRCVLVVKSCRRRSVVVTLSRRGRRKYEMTPARAPKHAARRERPLRGRWALNWSIVSPISGYRLALDRLFQGAEQLVARPADALAGPEELVALEDLGPLLIVSLHGAGSTLGLPTRAVRSGR